MRKLLMALVLMGALLVPGTTLASGSALQPIHISASAPIYGASGSRNDLSTYQVNIGQPGPASISGVVSDSGPIGLNIGLDGRFPHQLAGQIEVTGAHTHTLVTFTRVARCDNSIDARANGFVWSGTLTDTDTGGTWQISGAGRGNTLRSSVSGGLFTFDFAGVARP